MAWARPAPDLRMTHAGPRGCGLGAARRGAGGYGGGLVARPAPSIAGLSGGGAPIRGCRAGGAQRAADRRAQQW